MVEELKVQWVSIVHNWVKIEETLGFDTPRDGFMPAGRPTAISLWVQNARRKNVVIQPNAGDQFVEEWFKWWGSINPEWRQRTSGRLVIGGDGDWDCMVKPGKCGFLLILECLVGLREVAPVDDLTEAVRNVGWLLEQVLKSLQTRCVHHMGLIARNYEVSNIGRSSSDVEEPGPPNSVSEGVRKSSAKRKRANHKAPLATEAADEQNNDGNDSPAASKKARKVGLRCGARRL